MSQLARLRRRFGLGKNKFRVTVACLCIAFTRYWLYSQPAERIEDADYMALRRDYSEIWNDKEANPAMRSLDVHLWNKLNNIQFNSDCSRVLFCRLNKPCGFSCVFHQLVHCFSNAIAMNRTLVLDNEGWLYDSEWSRTFLPMSQCQLSGLQLLLQRTVNFFTIYSMDHVQDYPIVSLPLIDYYETEFEPPIMPPDVQRIVQVFSENGKRRQMPDIVWVGRLAKFLFMPTNSLWESWQNDKKTWPCEPYFGVHIRRTDKLIAEMEFHPVKEYMDVVMKHYSATQNCVYLATDEPETLATLQADYPLLRFVMKPKHASLAKHDRYSEESLFTIMHDIYYLSRTKYLVCTLSSHTCRLAFEMQNDYAKSYSLDDQWYFGGGIDRIDCIMDSERQLAATFNLKPGDKLLYVSGRRQSATHKTVIDPNTLQEITIPAHLGSLCPQQSNYPRFID